MTSIEPKTTFLATLLASALGLGGCLVSPDSPPLECQQVTGCARCIELAGCGWCPGVGCIGGDSIGPASRGLTCQNDYRWDTCEAAAPATECSGLNASACAGNARCSWCTVFCAPAGTCSPGTCADHDDSFSCDSAGCEWWSGGCHDPGERPACSSLGESECGMRADCDFCWDSYTCEPYGTCSSGLCTNTCSTPSDGECDDGGPRSQFSICALGTDCDDCGPR
ncbi:MAG: hypothetical protein AB7S26_11440 [Sandaracinaceae bacterium]